MTDGGRGLAPRVRLQLAGFADRDGAIAVDDAGTGFAARGLCSPIGVAQRTGFPAARALVLGCRLAAETRFAGTLTVTGPGLQPDPVEIRLDGMAPGRRVVPRAVVLAFGRSGLHGYDARLEGALLTRVCLEVVGLPDYLRLI